MIHGSDILSLMRHDRGRAYQGRQKQYPGDLDRKQVPAEQFAAQPSDVPRGEDAGGKNFFRQRRDGVVGRRR